MGIKMENNGRIDREIAKSYVSSLVDLKNNSKPLIDMLTMLAEKNIEHYPTIVDAVEERIAKVEAELKLPILYLIDSIVKNVGRVYIKDFGQSIVEIFIGAFEKVNDDIRKKMFALRQTWNDVFPPAKLLTLDVKVNAIDHNWPITAKKISTAIYENPNFLSTISEKDPQTKLQIKQRELAELKKRKLELTQKQLGLTPTSVIPPNQMPLASHFRTRIAPLESVESKAKKAKFEKMDILFDIKSIDFRIPPPSMLPLMSIVPNANIITTNSTNNWASVQLHPANTVANQQKKNLPVMSESSNPAVDVNDLYQKLLAIGIINKVREEEQEKSTAVSLSNPGTLKKRESSIINTLYSGTQCSSCGIRFPEKETIKYSQHLDWHYRQNRREKASTRCAQSRQWYYSAADWLQFKEIENLDEREKNWFEMQQTEMEAVNEESNQRSASPPPSCIADSGDHNRTCDICHDPFETFYNEETEEWHLRNAVRIDDNIYHPICYEDYKASLTLAESNMNVSNGNVSAHLPIKSDDEPTVTILDDDDDDDLVIL